MTFAWKMSNDYNKWNFFIFKQIKRKLIVNLTLTPYIIKNDI